MSEEERLREGLRAIRDQAAALPYPRLWTHWREIADRVLRGLPPHDPAKVAEYEQDVEREAHKAQCRKEGKCTDRSGRCAYPFGHYGAHSYEPHV